METKLIVKASKIHGVGCFTRVSIKKGEDISDFFGSDCKFTKREAVKDWLLTSIYCYQDVERGGYWGPTNFNRMSPGWYLNHSSKPNVRTYQDEKLVALKSIKAGQELTIDYKDLLN